MKTNDRGRQRYAMALKSVATATLLLELSLGLAVNRPGADAAPKSVPATSSLQRAAAASRKHASLDADTPDASRSAGAPSGVSL